MDRDHFLAFLDQIGDEGPRLVANHGPQGDRQYQIFALLPVAHVAFPVAPVSGGMVGVALIPEQRRDRRIGAKYHRTAGSAVTTCGLAFGLAFCPHKRSNPRTAVAGSEVDSNPVYEHDRKGLSRLVGRRRSGLTPDRNVTSVVAHAVLDGSWSGGEQSVVPTPGDVLTRMDASASLSHQDRTGVDELTVEHLGS
jgi:hypothetical protein